MWLKIKKDWFEENKEKLAAQYKEEMGEDGFYLISELTLSGLNSEIEWVDDSEVSITEYDHSSNVMATLTAQMGFKFTLDSMKYYLEQAEKQKKAIQEVLK